MTNLDSRNGTKTEAATARGDRAAVATELSQPLSQLSVGSEPMVASIAEGNRFIEGILERQRFSHAGSATISGRNVGVFLTENQGAAVLLVDDILVPERLSSGSTALAGIGGKLIPALVLPHPAEETVRGFIEAANLGGQLQPLMAVLEELRPNSRVEVLSHELEHMGDLLNGSPWGQVSLTRQYMEQQKHTARLPGELDALLLDHAPSTVERCASTLVMELKGFRHNHGSEPERARIAGAASDRISSALEHRDLDGVRDALRDWQSAIKSSKAGYNVGGPEALETAARWVIEFGVL